MIDQQYLILGVSCVSAELWSTGVLHQMAYGVQSLLERGQLQALARPLHPDVVDRGSAVSSGTHGSVETLFWKSRKERLAQTSQQSPVSNSNHFSIRR